MHHYDLDTLIDGLLISLTGPSRDRETAVNCSFELMVTERYDTLLFPYLCKAWATSHSFAWLEGLRQLRELTKIPFVKRRRTNNKKAAAAEGGGGGAAAEESDEEVTRTKKMLSNNGKLLDAVFNFVHNSTRTTSSRRTTMLKSMAVLAHQSEFVAPESAAVSKRRRWTETVGDHLKRCVSGAGIPVPSHYKHPLAEALPSSVVVSLIHAYAGETDWFHVEPAFFGLAMFAETLWKLVDESAQCLEYASGVFDLLKSLDSDAEYTEGVVQCCSEIFRHLHATGGSDGKKVSRYFFLFPILMFDPRTREQWRRQNDPPLPYKTDAILIERQKKGGVFENFFGRSKGVELRRFQLPLDQSSRHTHVGRGGDTVATLLNGKTQLEKFKKWGLEGILKSHSFGVGVPATEPPHITPVSVELKRLVANPEGVPLRDPFFGRYFAVKLTSELEAKKANSLKASRAPLEFKDMGLAMYHAALKEQYEKEHPPVACQWKYATTAEGVCSSGWRSKRKTRVPTFAWLHPDDATVSSPQLPPSTFITVVLPPSPLPAPSPPPPMKELTSEHAASPSPPPPPHHPPLQPSPAFALKRKVQVPIDPELADSPARKKARANDGLAVKPKKKKLTKGEKAAGLSGRRTRTKKRKTKRVVVVVDGDPDATETEDEGGIEDDDDDDGDSEAKLLLPPPPPPEPDRAMVVVAEGEEEKENNTGAKPPLLYSVLQAFKRYCADFGARANSVKTTGEVLSVLADADLKFKTIFNHLSS